MAIKSKVNAECVKVFKPWKTLFPSLRQGEIVKEPNKLGMTTSYSVYSKWKKIVIFAEVQGSTF